jgi:RNA polymerase sigma-B factor
MKAQATPPQWHTRPNMAADLANVRTTATAVGAAPPKGGKPTDGQVADWLRGYAERRDPSDRERIILAHLDLADRLAARYRDRPNTTPDDLRQTARVGLIGAVDRYDPTRGTPFLPYAIASIIGELKRYLRDATWSVRVSRTMKQHVMELLRVRDGLACGGGRWPPVAELANRLGLTHDEVIRAMQAAENRTALSLDVPVDSEDTTPLGALLPDPEPTVALEDLLMLPDLVASLPAAERTAVVSHYFKGRKQREIAVEIGCSQMGVSRLLRRALERLRDQLVGGDMQGSTGPADVGSGELVGDS